jgi:hypothetical protein
MASLWRQSVHYADLRVAPLHTVDSHVIVIVVTSVESLSPLGLCVVLLNPQRRVLYLLKD